jgi:hypothetical protein
VTLPSAGSREVMIVAPLRPSRDYGRGRVAECGHRLCRYHPDSAECWPCEFTRKRGSSASAAGEAGTNAAPAARAVKGAR